MAADPVTNGFAVGYRQGEGLVSSLDPYPGYGVAYFEFDIEHARQRQETNTR